MFWLMTSRFLFLFLHKTSDCLCYLLYFDVLASNFAVVVVAVVVVVVVVVLVVVVWCGCCCCCSCCCCGVAVFKVC